MIAKIIARIISNSLALYAASFLVPGFLVQGGFREYALAGLALALLNMVLAPLLKIISFPLMLITFGLFSLVINAAMLWLVAYRFDFIFIDGWTALALATIVVSLVNGVLHMQK